MSDATDEPRGVPPSGLDARTLSTALKTSTSDGILANAMSVLQGGIFLTGFAIYLGATPSQIGFMAAIPLLTNLLQVAGAYLIDQFGERTLSLASAIVARGTWVLIFAIPLLFSFFPADETRRATFIPLFLVLIVISSLGASVSGLAWIAWMRRLVPEESRGRYFGWRNSLTLGAGVTVSLVFGWAFDVVTRSSPAESGIAGASLDGRATGFAMVFGFSLLFAFFSTWQLAKIPAPISPRPQGSARPLRERLSAPFRDRAFRKMTSWSALWAFMCALASPFFAVYFLTVLKLSFTELAILDAINGVAHAIGSRFFGPLCDRHGPRAVVSVCSLAASVLPFFVLLADKGNALIVLGIWTALVGLSWSGINLGQGALLLRNVPESDPGPGFALFTAANGLTSAIAPICSGYFLERFSGHSLSMTLALNGREGPVLHHEFLMGGFAILFLVSVPLRLLALPRLAHVPDSKETPLIPFVRILLSTPHALLANRDFSHFWHFLTRAGSATPEPPAPAESTVASGSPGTDPDDRP